MIRENSHYKKYADCRKLISFSEFLRDNPSIKVERAKKLWNDFMISIYCPECYFNRPEKPFSFLFRIFIYKEWSERKSHSSL